MGLAFLTMTNTNASSVRVHPASDFNSVPRYVDVETDSDNDQSWYWTPAWQAAEREADEDLADGRYRVFESADDFLDSL